MADDFELGSKSKCCGAGGLRRQSLSQHLPFFSVARTTFASIRTSEQIDQDDGRHGRYVVSNPCADTYTRPFTLSVKASSYSKRGDGGIWPVF